MDETNHLIDGPCAFAPSEAEQAANLCPECEGYGSWFFDPTGARDWETGEYLDAYGVPCNACHGTGWLTEIAA